MTSLIFGLAAALAFAVGTLASARASRTLGPVLSVAWASTFGLLILVPFVFASGIPQGVTGGQIALVLFGAVANLFGFLTVFAAFAVGKVGLVAPIVATEGAVAAVLATVTGASLEPVIGFLLIVVVLGIIIATRSHDPLPFANERPARAALLASLGAVFFGINLFVVGVLSGEVPLPWLLLPGRVIALVGLLIPLALLGRLRITRSSAPLLVLMGLCDLLGVGFYAIGAEVNLAVTAVVSSQMAPIAALLALILFRERLGKGQVAGMAIIVTALSILSVVQ